MSPDRIDKLFKSLGWTTSRAAYILGVHRNTIYNWRYGRQDPQPCALILLQLLDRHPELAAELEEDYNAILDDSAG